MPIDRLIRFTAQQIGQSSPTLRVFMVKSTSICEHARQIHSLTPISTVALGRGLTGGVLLAALTKSERSVNLQIAGDGPLGGLFIDAQPDGGVRGFPTRNPETKMRIGGVRPSLGYAIGQNGFVNVLRADNQGTYFRSSVKLRTGEVDDDLAEYLEASEQVESAIALDVVLTDDERVHSAGGILLQALPGHEGSLDELRQTLSKRMLYRLLRDHPTEWTDKITDELHLTLSPVTETLVRFHCHCSEERVLAALAAAGVDELTDMIEKEGKAEISCDFCAREYLFNREQLTELRDLALSVSPGRIDN